MFFNFGSQSDWNLLYVDTACLVVMLGVLMCFITRFVGNRFAVNRSTLKITYFVELSVSLVVVMIILWAPVRFCISSYCESISAPDALIVFLAKWTYFIAQFLGIRI